MDSSTRRREERQKPRPIAGFIRTSAMCFFPVLPFPSTDILSSLMATFVLRPWGRRLDVRWPNTAFLTCSLVHNTLFDLFLFAFGDHRKISPRNPSVNCELISPVSDHLTGNERQTLVKQRDLAPIFISIVLRHQRTLKMALLLEIVMQVGGFYGNSSLMGVRGALRTTLDIVVDRRWVFSRIEFD